MMNFLGRNPFWTLNCWPSARHSASGLEFSRPFFSSQLRKVTIYTLLTMTHFLFCFCLSPHLLNILYLCLLHCNLARLLLSLRMTNLTFTLYVLLSWCYVLVYMYVCMCTCFNLYISLMKLTRVILFLHFFIVRIRYSTASYLRNSFLPQSN